MQPLVFPMPLQTDHRDDTARDLIADALAAVCLRGDAEVARGWYAHIRVSAIRIDRWQMVRDAVRAELPDAPWLLLGD